MGLCSRRQRNAPVKLQYILQFVNPGTNPGSTYFAFGRGMIRESAAKSAGNRKQIQGFKVSAGRIISTAFNGTVKAIYRQECIQKKQILIKKLEKVWAKKIRVLYYNFYLQQQGKIIYKCFFLTCFWNIALLCWGSRELVATAHRHK